MPAPVFILGSLVTLLLFVATAMLTTSASPWTILGASLCAWLLLQFGYLAYICGLVAIERRRRARARDAPLRDEPGEAGEAADRTIGSVATTGRKRRG